MTRWIPAVLACASMSLPVFAQDKPEEPKAEAAPKAAPITDPGADKIRVGTWNIENLGSRGRRAQDFQALADYIKELKVDLLGLQEVNGATPLTKLTKHLGADWKFVVGSSGNVGRKQIGLGFLWNTKRVKLVQAEEYLHFPRQKGRLYVFHRKPISAVFKAVNGGVDFRAVVVHFKAGQLNRGRRWKKSSDKRQAEVAMLGDHIKALLSKDGEDQDLLVLGDYNHDRHYPAFKVFSQYLTYQAPVTKHQTIFYFKEQIDHIATSKGLEEELVKDSCHIRFGKYAESRDRWKKVYSDHIPVTIDLSSKDNDQATFSPPVKAEQKLEAQPKSNATPTPASAKKKTPL